MWPYSDICFYVFWPHWSNLSFADLNKMVPCSHRVCPNSWSIYHLSSCWSLLFYWSSQSHYFALAESSRGQCEFQKKRKKERTGIGALQNTHCCAVEIYQEGLYRLSNFGRHKKFVWHNTQVDGCRVVFIVYCPGVEPDSPVCGSILGKLIRPNDTWKRKVRGLKIWQEWSLSSCHLRKTLTDLWAWGNAGKE